MVVTTAAIAGRNPGFPFSDDQAIASAGGNMSENDQTRPIQALGLFCPGKPRAKGWDKKANS